MKQIGKVMIALIIMSCMVVLPAMAEAGTHYTSQPVYPEKTFAPAATETPTQYGTLKIGITRFNDYEPLSRYVSIAPVGPEPVIHPVISLNGIGDIRLPAGQYYVVLPNGYGSGFEMDTWKPEAFDVTISDGGVSYVTFVGAGYGN